MSSDADTVIVVLDAPELGEARPVAVVARRPGPKLTIETQYVRSWLESDAGFAIEPGLPLVEASTFTTGPLPAILSDTAPDRWGRRLLDHRAGQQLDEWQYLLRVHDRTRMGALRMTRAVDGPFIAADAEGVPPMTALRALQATARRIEEDPDAILDDEVARLLLAPGSSLGGIRPKANVVDPDGGLWIAKFPARTDRRDVGAWERVYTRLAERAGIAVPETDLLAIGDDGRTFLSRRFDRTPEGRRLYASARTLSGVLDGDGDYADIAHAIATTVDPEHVRDDLAAMYRRMVFNVLAGDRDDHLRNHGFLRAPTGWRLAPAFDLNPAESLGHATAIDGRLAEIDVEHLRDARSYFELETRPATRIIDEVAEVVGTWREIAREVGIGRSEQDRVARALAPLPAFV